MESICSSSLRWVLVVSLFTADYACGSWMLFWSKMKENENQPKDLVLACSSCLILIKVIQLHKRMRTIPSRLCSPLQGQDQLGIGEKQDLASKEVSEHAVVKAVPQLPWDGSSCAASIATAASFSQRGLSLLQEPHCKLGELGAPQPKRQLRVLNCTRGGEDTVLCLPWDRDMLLLSAVHRERCSAVPAPSPEPSLGKFSQGLSRVFSAAGLCCNLPLLPAAHPCPAAVLEPGMWG